METSQLVEGMQKGKVQVFRPDKYCIPRFSKLVEEINKYYWNIESMDMLILACGMVDDSCKGLLSFERKLIDNRGLVQVNESQYGNAKFTVSDQAPF